MESQAQDYFSKNQVGEIAYGLMNLSGVGDFSPNAKVRATQILNSFRIMKNRLGMDRQALRVIYTNHMIPASLSSFFRAYSDGKLSREHAETILDELDTKVRRYFFRNKIAYGDPESLPNITLLDLSMVLGYAGPERNPEAGLKERLEEVIKEAQPSIDYHAKATEIMKKSKENPTGVVAVEVVAESLADILIKGAYNSVMIDCGSRDPTRERLALTYIDSLQKAYQSLGIESTEGLIGREKIMTQRMTDQAYAEALQDFNANIEGLLIIGGK